MIDLESPEVKAKLGLLLTALGRFDQLDYSSQVTQNGWRELAIVLLEETSDLRHAQEMIDRFLKNTARLDGKGFRRNDVPSAPELREFIQSQKTVAALPEKPIGPPPAPCVDCEPFDGQWRQKKAGSGVERCPCDLGKYRAKLRAYDAAKAGNR